MKKPKSPIPFQDLHRELLAEDSDILLKAMLLSSTELGARKYYHWDQILRKEPPKELTHKQWWFAIKVKRIISFRDAPLKDNFQRPFSYNLTDTTAEQLREIDLGFGGSIGGAEGALDPATRDRYYLNSLVEEAITSSQLEGAATTRVVAKNMIRRGLKPKDKDERMILNNYHAMKEINKFKDEPLTKELVFHLHEIVTRDTLDYSGASGRFRRADEEIVVAPDGKNVVHIPPPADELPSRMKQMCDFANGKVPEEGEGFIHPAIRSIILHFWLAYDHPFVDGNGRTARALQYWSMLHHHYWLFEFISISSIMLEGPLRYSRSFLYTETDERDLTYFIIYNLDVICRAKAALDEYIERKKTEQAALETRVKEIAYLNHRQRALIVHALKHQGYYYTFREHRTIHNVAHQTARTDLIGLSKMGLLHSEKIKGRWIFRPVPDIEDRLKRLSRGVFGIPTVTLQSPSSDSNLNQGVDDITD